MKEGEDPDKVVPIPAAAPATSELVYAVELWDLRKAAPERVIGRAGSMVLARAIFAAAQNEHVGRRIVLRRGERILAESG